MLPTVTYCEQPLDLLIKRPWYALSNFAYIGLGIYLLLKKDDKLAKLFGFLSLLIGLCSFVYDSSFTYTSQLLDLFAMVLFATTLIFISVARLIKSRSTFIAGLFMLVVFAMLMIITFKGFAGNIAFGTLVSTYIVIELRNYMIGRRINMKYWYWGLSIFILGISFWYLDVNKLYCLELGLLNGRAVFHYLGAISVYLLYRFYSSQTESIL
jgi:hypothetical protein